MQLLTVPSMSLACEVPDFDESIVGSSGQVETRRRETNVSHIPACKVKRSMQILLHVYIIILL